MNVAQLKRDMAYQFERPICSFPRLNERGSIEAVLPYPFGRIRLPVSTFE